MKIPALIILILIGITWTILDTVVQPKKQTCEKEGSTIPCAQPGQEPK